MKKRKKLITFVAAGALSFGMVGGSIQAFATPTKPNVPSEESQEKLDPETKQKADEIISNLKGELIKLGVKVPENKYQLYAGIDEDKKEQAKEILEKVKSGELTTEEAEEQFKELGIEIPEQHKKKLESFDEKTKEKVKDILDKRDAGELTKEEADKQLDELGVTLPEQEESDPLSNLDEETREKVTSLIEEAKIQLKEIGADHYYEILNHLSR